MALIFHDGFETGGADAWDNVVGSPTFVAGAANTGNYGMRCSVSAATAYIDNGIGFDCTRASFYLYIADDPDGLTIIFGTTGKINLRLNGTTIYLYDVGTSKGSYSLSTGQWYRICFAADGAGNCKVYIDGTERISSVTMGEVDTRVRIGCSTDVSADLYFDDLACDLTASTDDLGNIKTLAARPVGEGTDQDLYTTDSDYWAEHTVSDDAVYSEIDDDPPSTSTFNFAQGDAAKTARYSVTLDDCGSGNLSGIGASDTIEAVNFMWYYETDAGGSDDYGIRIRCSDDAGSPLTNDNIDDPKDPTWYDDATYQYHVDTPAGGNPWTQAYVNSLEMGMGSITNGGKEQWWYEAYAMMAFKVVSAGLDVNVNDANPAVTDATSQYITPYLITQSDSNPDVTDASQQYINPHLTEQYDSAEVTDYADVSIPVADVDIDVADAPAVTDSSSQYITPYLISIDDDIGLQDASDQYLTVYEINVADDLSLQDVSEQYLNLYVVYSDDDIAIEDVSSQYLDKYLISTDDSLVVEDYTSVRSDINIYAYDDLAVVDFVSQYLSLYEVNVDDDLSIQDESSQYLTLYEVNVSDNLEAQENISLELSYYEINVDDDIEVTDYADIQVTAADQLYVTVDDDIGLQDSTTVQFDKYLISVDDDLAVEDSISSYLTIYLIEQYDGLTITDYTDVSITAVGVLSINVYDDLTVQDSSAAYLTIYLISQYESMTFQDYSEQSLSLYLISASEDVTIQDDTDNALDLFLISEADDLTVADSIDAQMTPYLISEYESITVTEYNENLIAYKSKSVNVFDSIGASDYAGAGYIIYPFLRAFLTIKATRSEINVKDDKTVLSVIRSY